MNVVPRNSKAVRHGPSLTVVAGIALAIAFISPAQADDAHQGHEPATGGLSKIWPSQATGAPEKVVYDAASAMEFFRTMSGDWVNLSAASENESGSYGKADANGKGDAYGDGKGTAKSAAGGMHIGGTNFKTIASGSTVEQTYLAGTPYEMTLMYHMNGPDQLLLNHFCAARNVPQMKFEKSNKPGEIKFEFDGGTNLNPQVDSHAHAATFNIIDKDTFELNGVAYDKGERKLTHSVYKRKDTAEKKVASAGD